mmetsp:Transcript_38904/g.69661  ORF Transcript_38904/g.69661 Transcript_38904/m.69661 type:complete len:209 (+) Transcript_38904:5782-6408(+)
MASARAQLHHKHRRAGHLRPDLIVIGNQLLLVGRHADPLAATALRRLEHDRVADAVRGVKGLLKRVDAALVEGLLGNGAILGEVSHESIATPWDGGHTGGLSQDVGSNLVAQYAHDRGCWSDKCDATFLERARQLRLLTGVAPARPHGISANFGCQRHDEGDIGVVVPVGATRNLDEVIRLADELGVCGQVLGSCHGDKGDGVLIAKG